MPRIRTIKPEIAADVKLAALSIPARYTFILLISQADDDGLVAGSHRQLLGALYPHDDTISAADLLSWIEELVIVRLARWRSTVDGAPVLEITNWTKHQRIDNKGRSQIAGLLAPLAAIPELPKIVATEPQTQIAEVRRDSPQVAEVRGLEEGSRTLEVGPRTEDRATVATDRVAVFVNEHPFGACAASVEGIIRSARNGDAVIATLRMHLSGEMGHERATASELGLACQQYLANGEAFKPAFFAGFIRRSKRGVERTENRKRNTAEQRSIDSEERDRATADEEDRRADAWLEKFAADNPEKFAELQRRAEAVVPKKLTMGREIIVRQNLIRLIRDEAA